MSEALFQGRAVTDFFDADAANWDAYYERRDVFSVVHQLRRSLALAWVDDLGLAAGARVLEVGCGTGLFAIALAERGFQVTAADSATNMLARAEANVADAGLRGVVTLLRADAERLPVPSESFDLVVALGLLPWVFAPRDAVAEMVRALVPGGHLMVNCDNRHRLTALLDPRHTPVLAGVRSAARRLPGRAKPAEKGVRAVRHLPAEFDRLLAEVGAPVERSRTFGFGPFTLMGREVLPAWVGVSLHRGLQHLADVGLPGIRATGAQYLVRALKA